MSQKPPPMIAPLPMTPIGQLTGEALSTPVESSISTQSLPLPGPIDPLSLPPPAVDNLSPPTKRSNPGPMERCDQEIQRVLRVDTFDGARFELQKMLGPHFATAHTLYMGSSAHEKGYLYSFGTTLVLGDALLTGRFDHMSRVDAQWHQSYSGPIARFSHRIQAQLTPQENHAVVDLERKGDDNTAGLKLGNGLVGLSYFQAVTPRLAVGGEGSYLKRFGAMHLTARGRYTDNNNTLVCTASTMGSVSASFLRRISNRCGLACELEVATANLNSHMSFGAEFIMRQAKFHANVTSTGIIQATLQDIIGNNCFLLLSATVDHRNDIYRFGVGVQLG